MLPSSPRDKVNTQKTPKIRGFQTFQAEFAVYLPFIAQKIVVVPCGSCGAATFFLPKNQRRTSQERNARRSCYAVCFALYAVLSGFCFAMVIYRFLHIKPPEVNTGENKSILAACSPLYVIIDIFDRLTTAL